jgi:hypothetical protein
MLPNQLAQLLHFLGDHRLKVKDILLGEERAQSIAPLPVDVVAYRCAHAAGNSHGLELVAVFIPWRT